MPNGTCIITGASKGIGLATAVRFARRGFNVVMTARDEKTLKNAVARVAKEGGQCVGVAADVGVRAEAQHVAGEALKQFGGVDVLVNNAGAAPLAEFDKFSPEDFERCVATNIAGVFHLTHAIWGGMKKNGRGTIVSVSSVAAIDPFPGFAVYGACKAWVNAFTKALAAEGKPLGIRVFAVAPGGVETGLFRASFPDYPGEKLLQPDDVAGLIEAVCDERMKYVSGETIFIQK
jgi:NAD(P)-dependent dehydrogenase (short-subunit alcohol dehydrogenase family)